MKPLQNLTSSLPVAVPPLESQVVKAGGQGEYENCDDHLVESFRRNRVSNERKEIYQEKNF